MNSVKKPLEWDSNKIDEASEISLGSFASNLDIYPPVLVQEKDPQPAFYSGF